MSKQFMVTIARQFGSGGHIIASDLAEKLGVDLYDENLISAAIKASKSDTEALREDEEKPRNKWVSRTYHNYKTSVSDIVAERQFLFMKHLAEQGESFVVVGRCSENVLADYPGLISIYVTADEDAKVSRIMQLYEKTEPDARKMILKMDRSREEYHNSHFKNTWGKASNYDLIVNSSRLGLEKTSEFLYEYIKLRIGE